MTFNAAHETKVVRKCGLCRKQLMKIIREKMTPLKLCKSWGEIKPGLLQLTKEILGIKDDDKATAEQK